MLVNDNWFVLATVLSDQCKHYLILKGIFWGVGIVYTFFFKNWKLRHSDINKLKAT